MSHAATGRLTERQFSCAPCVVGNHAHHQTLFDLPPYFTMGCSCLVCVPPEGERP